MRGAALVALAAHWRRHPWRLLTLVLGLGAATALWSGVQAINGQAREAYARASDLIALAALSVIAPEGRAPTVADFVQLRREGLPVTPVLRGTLREGRQSFALTGIDVLSHPLATVLATATGGDYAAMRDTLFAGPQTARRLEGFPGLPPVRVIEGVIPGQVFADIGLAATLLNQPDGLSALLLTKPLPGPPPKGWTVTAPGPSMDVSGLAGSFHLNLTAFGFLAFCVGLFILHGQIGLAFEDRRATIRTMRAIGLPLRDLALVMALEMAALALIAGALGLALGYAIAAALLPGVSATLSGLFGVPGTTGLTLRPEWIAGGLGMALAGTAVAGGWTLMRVARMPVLAPAMPRAWARASARAAGPMAAAGGLAFVAGLVAQAIAGGLAGGFALMGGMLLGAALVLPLVLRLGLNAAGSRARGPVARWFWADTAHQLPGLSLALMALLLALAANIGVTTMVASFRATFTGWLDQRLTSNIYVTARNDAEAGRLSAWLAPRSDAVLPIWHAGIRLSGRPAAVYGIADNPIYPRSWPMLSAEPMVWKKVHDGDGALVSEQTARRAHLALGDMLELKPGYTVEIAGIYSDYGNADGQVVVSVPALLAHFPDVDRLRFGVLVAPGKVAALKSDLVKDFGLPADNITDQRDLKAFSLSVFERTFSVTRALNWLTLAIAGFAMLTSLLTLGTLRLPQVAPVWAIGLGRGTLARLEVARAAALAAGVMVLALPLGLALAWVLLAVVNPAAFGWRLPLIFFPADWARLGAMALAAALLSAALPAMRLARMPPARLTQVFAHER